MNNNVSVHVCVLAHAKDPIPGLHYKAGTMIGLQHQVLSLSDLKVLVDYLLTTDGIVTDGRLEGNITIK